MQAQQTDSSDIEVAWLPSMPLIYKRKAPSIAGVGVLYSEEADQIIDVFETTNLAQSLGTSMRRQSRALARDPNCRICWLEESDSSTRELLYKKLLQRVSRPLTTV